MSAFIILVIASLLIAIGFLISFLLSVKQGQFDDSVTPPVRMLFDDVNNESDSEENTQTNLK